MKVAVIGSRSFTNYKAFTNKLYDLLGDTRPHFISGGADGPDSMAQRYAQKMGYSITIHYPDWSIGKQAGMLRNRQIIEEAEWIIAWWDGVSPGTRGAIELAERMGKRVEIVLVKVKEAHDEQAN